MTPVTVKMECIENMLNGYAFDKTAFIMKLGYAVLFMALTTTVTILNATYIYLAMAIAHRKTAHHQQDPEACGF